LFNILNAIDPNSLPLAVIDAYLNNATLGLNTKEAIADGVIQ